MNEKCDSPIKWALTYMNNQAIIADFIGERLPKSEGYAIQWQLPMCDGYYPSVANMKFETSMDWLMPAITKIQKMGYRVNINFGDITQCAISNIDPMMHVVEKSVFDAVVKFIKWYNNQ